MSLPAALRQALPLPEAEDWATRLAGLEPEALWWLSGYAAALAAARAGGATQKPIATAPATAAARATVIYGSQTGNARRAAEALVATLEGEGLAVRLLRADAYPQRELAAERLVYFVLSTQGDGDPSDDAQGLIEWLEGKRAPKLPGLRYAVLGLGDSSYAKFCEIGRRVDARLAELGAQRTLARADADLDIEAIATPWRAQALAQARELLKSEVPLATVTPLRPPAAPTGTRERPALLELLANQRLTGQGSDKDVRHIELDLAGSGLRYQPGDVFGLFAPSPPALVDAVLRLGELDGDALVEHGGESLPLRTWLTERRELTRLARPTLQAIAQRGRDAALSNLLASENQAELAALLERFQLIDALRRWPVRFEPADLVAALRPLAPRLYSIASSQAAVGEELHLAVDVVGFGDAEPLRLGTASHHLAASGEGARLRGYIEPNERFRLPADAARDAIMIGPGTGVAPFRAFVQEREADGAPGRNWLFFGARRFRTDFLYQTEWQAALKSGALHRLDLAFSRDGEQKTYVQQKLLEHGRDLVEWIEGGAHLYVCGAQAMGRDVHAALLAVFASRLGGRERAEARLKSLQQEGRYARDVY
jgi:sulfite reductase (NADPH) flavoprotein alpha-component